jgi:hypothetical protein
MAKPWEGEGAVAARKNSTIARRLRRDMTPWVPGL